MNTYDRSKTCRFHFYCPLTKNRPLINVKTKWKPIKHKFLSSFSIVSESAKNRNIRELGQSWSSCLSTSATSSIASGHRCKKPSRKQFKFCPGVAERVPESLTSQKSELKCPEISASSQR